jgi:hypothetical protein
VKPRDAEQMDKLKVKSQKKKVRVLKVGDSEVVTQK